jgi:hypothetical protein
VVQVAITTAVATTIATWRLTGLDVGFLKEWLLAWALALLTMLPIVIFAAPFIQRCVEALTMPTAGEGKG